MENKNKINAAEIVKPAAILTAICIIVTFLLAVTNALTAGKIAENSEKKAAESRFKVLEADSYVQLDKEGVVFEAIKEDGKSAGVVVVTDASGYGGTIEVMTGIKLNGEISGVNILSMDETPGMGAKAKESSFLDQYLNKSESSMSVTKDGGEIDAISGATITSRAVTQAVNDAIDIAAPYLAEINQTTGGEE